MIKSISQEYASLGPRRSISTLVPSFLIAQTAVLLGVPVSFNEIVVSAIVGSGLAVAGGAGVNPRKLGITVAAWVGSFVLAFDSAMGRCRSPVSDCRASNHLGSAIQYAQHDRFE